MVCSAVSKSIDQVADVTYLTPAPTVLVAGTNVIKRKHIAREIARDGYKVSESGLDGTVLRRLSSRSSAKQPVEVVILDLTGEKERGLDLLEAVRALDWGLRVILLVQDEDPRLQQEASRLGANATFTQPFDLDDLRTVVLNVAPRV